MWEKIKEWCDFENFTLVVGTAVLARGVYLWWPPGAWITIGCILLLVWCILVVATLRGHKGE